METGYWEEVAKAAETRCSVGVRSMVRVRVGSMLLLALIDRISPLEKSKTLRAAG
jgi:hypothetical protein